MQLSCKVWRLWSRGEKLSCHVTMVAKFLDLNKLWSCKSGRKKNEKIEVYDFPVHDCTQEQNSSPYFTSIIGQCKWLLLWRKVVEIQKFCYHGNNSSHSPLLLRLCSKKNWRGPSASTAPSIIRVVFWVIFGSRRFCSVVQCSQAGIYCFVWTEMENFVVFSIILYMWHQNVHVTALLHDENCYNR